MIERRAVQRHRVMLPALCWNRNRSDFYAVTEDVSSDGIRFRSAVVPSVDERLTCGIRHLGAMETRVVRIDANAFVVKPDGTARQNGGFAQELLRLARQQEGVLEPTRVHPRIVPRQADIVVTLPSGATIPASVVNVSASGAALQISRKLDVGTVIVMGTTSATVVRTFANGLGVAFPTLLDPARVNAYITL